MIILAIIAIVAIIVIAAYNKLVTLKNQIGNSYADMDVQMKMRFDLVDNLVNTVKGYASHEKDTLENITKARTSFMGATGPADKAAADSQMSGALKSLFAVSENYPDLKANTNFLQLQTQLTDIETQIAGSRRYYNATIKDYNNALMSFPSNILAKTFGFTQEGEYFAVANESEKAAPKVDFSKE
jgi:LemA protein